MDYQKTIEQCMQLFKQFNVSDFNFKVTEGKLAVKFKVDLNTETATTTEKVEEKPKQEIVNTPEAIDETLKDAQQEIINSPKTIGEILEKPQAQKPKAAPKKEEEKTFFDNVMPVKVEEPVTTPAPKKQIVLTDKVSLYKDHVFTEDEKFAIQEYMHHKIKPKEAAELLNLPSAKDFNNLVNQYLRCQNVKKKPRSEKEIVAPVSDLGPNIKPLIYKGINLADIYTRCSKGETLTSIAKQTGITQGTLSYHLKKFVQQNKLPSCFPGHAGGRIAGVSSRSKKDTAAKEEKGNVKTVTAKTKTITPTNATKTAKVDLIVEKGTPNGWFQLNDGKFHRVENGVVVE